jgi:hypothetical protein
LPDRATPRASRARPSPRAVAAACAAALLLCGASFAGPALATPAEEIIERCAHQEHVSLGGFTPSEYAQALRQLPTEVREYDGECEEQIRDAELAAAGGQSTATGASAAAAASVTPPTPAEQRALTTSARKAPVAIQLGSHTALPGVVHVDVASALNALPTPLMALVAIVVLACLALGVAYLPRGLLQRLGLRPRR